jgi:hypothetical protein
MHVAIIERSLESVFDWIFTVDPQESKKYIEQIHSTYPSLSRREIVQKIVDEQSINNGFFGAITGLGSTITLPIVLPLDILKAWKIQSFMIRCLAEVYGYTPKNMDLKTATLLLVSSGSIEELKEFVWHGATTAVNERALMTFDSLKQSAIQMAAKKGSKMATKALYELVGKKIAKNVMKEFFGLAAPAFGAAIGGSVDWMTTQAVGRLAIEYFENSGPQLINSMIGLPVESNVE